MRDISTEYRDRLREGSTQLVKLWRVQLVNGGAFFFAEGSEDVLYDGVLYKARPGIQISAMREAVDTGYGDATVTILTSDESISAAAVLYNDLRGAKFSVWMVHRDLLDAGHMPAYAGRIGDITKEGTRAEVDVKGQGDLGAGYKIGEVYSEQCRNTLGDLRCGVNLYAYEVPFVVEAANPFTGQFIISITIPDEDEPNTNTELVDLASTEITTPGAGVYVVPECTQLTVTVVGAGGVADSSRSIADFGLKETDDGENSTFATGPLQIAATGGKHGKKAEYITDTGEWTIIANIDGDHGTGLGGDENGSWGVLDTFYLFDMYGSQQKIFHVDDNYNGGVNKVDIPLIGENNFTWNDMFTFMGGSGGYATKVYSVGDGPDADFAPGDEIPYVIGEGGQSVHHPEHPEYNGGDGLLRISSRQRISILDDISEVQHDWGTIRWVSGDNKNRIHMVDSVVDGSKIKLVANSYRPIRQGDRGRYRPGCSRYRSMCIEKFDNLPRMRAEPDVPNVIAVIEPVVEQPPAEPPDTDGGSGFLPWGPPSVGGV